MFTSYLRLTIIAVTTLLIIVGCTSSSLEPIDSKGVIVPVSNNSETYKIGKTVYDTICSSCHGINGEGQFPEAPLMPDTTGRYGAPPHNDEGHTWHHDDDLLLQIITEGGVGTADAFYPMPAFGDALTDQQKIAVISYIKTMWNEQHLASQYRITEAVRARAD